MLILLMALYTNFLTIYHSTSVAVIIQGVHTREDETIESAVPFPAPAKGDNRGLSPFNLGQYIALPFPENHWSVQKISPRPLPRKPGLKGVNPFSPLYIISLFVPVPFPGLLKNFSSGVPGNHWFIFSSFFPQFTFFYALYLQRYDILTLQSSKILVSTFCTP